MFILCEILLSCLPNSTTAFVSPARKPFTPLKVCIHKICVITLAICDVKFVRSLASLVVMLKYARY